MNGTEFTARDRFTIGIFLALGLIGLLLWGAFASDGDPIGWYAAAAIPAIFILLRLARRLPVQHLRLTEEGISSRRSGHQVPYASIRSVTIDGHLRDPGSRIKDPLVITHDAGQLIIPPVTSGIRIDDLHAHLLSRLTPRPPQLPSTLVSHYRAELKKFGPERVFAFDVRPLPRIRSKGRGTRLFGASLLIWGVAASAAGLSIDGGGGWLGAGVTSLFFSLIVYLIGVTQTQDLQPAKKFKSAGIVISPSSFALSQGSLSGTLRWEEILRVRLASRGTFQLSSVSTRTGIFIEPAGTFIPVADIYNISRSALLQLIQSYWRPPAA